MRHKYSDLINKRAQCFYLCLLLCWLHVSGLWFVYVACVCKSPGHDFKTGVCDTGGCRLFLPWQWDRNTCCMKPALTHWLCTGSFFILFCITDLTLYRSVELLHIIKNNAAPLPPTKHPECCHLASSCVQVLEPQYWVPVVLQPDSFSTRFIIQSCSYVGHKT